MKGSPKPERCGNAKCADSELLWSPHNERWFCACCGWHPADPALDWTRVWDRPYIGGHGYHSSQERAEAKAKGTHKPVEQLSKRERVLTPPPFRDLLVELARTGQEPALRLKQAVLT